MEDREQKGMGEETVSVQLKTDLLHKNLLQYQFSSLWAFSFSCYGR